MPIDSIKILPSKEIDKAKWDACVRENENGFLFADTHYLDCMAKNWDGLIIDDYHAVLPLIWNKKFGIKYLYPAPFVRQLGLIGTYSSTCNIFSELSKPYRYGDVAFNYNNNDIVNEHCAPKRNYILNLHREYSDVYAAYKKSLKQKLNKTSSLRYAEADFDDVIDAYRKHITQKYKDMPDEFERLKRLCRTDFGKQYFHPYQVMDEAGNTLLLGIYAKDDKRVYKFMTTHINDGKEKYAMLFAVDFLIRKYANQPLLYDFMGSEILGVNAFIQNFSPQEQIYFLYHFNHLPRLVRLLKK